MQLSAAQERLWFLQQWDPRSGAYNRASAFRLRGALRLDALQASLDTIVERHEVLRSGFSAPDGLPSICIRAAGTTPITLIEAADTVTGLAVLRDEALRPFDIATDCLLRAVVVRLDADDHLLLFVTHHIAADRWSDAVLFAELQRLYAADGDPERAGLPPLDLQYADVATWQRSRTAEGDERYWRGVLDGVPHVLQLPGARGPANQAFEGSIHRFAVNADLAGRLRAVASQEGATLFVALLAGFATLLRRWSGANDFVVGVPCAGRTHTETERLIGCFVNTLALRCQVESGRTFRDLLRQLRQTALGAQAHAELPFERVIELVAPERASSHSPLVQVMFALQNTPPARLRLSDLVVEPIVLDLGISKFELTLEVVEAEEGLSCAIEYATARFEPAAIRRLADRWTSALRALVANPDDPVDAVSLVTPDEAAQLRAWNQTDDAGCDTNACIHELVQRRAVFAGDVVAIAAGSERVTYADLDARANRLAHLLRARGAGPGTLVGVCLERTPDLIVALLAVLKAGAAYVPLDPEYPQPRIAAIVEQAQPAIVLCASPVSRDAFLERVLDITGMASVIADQPSTPPASVTSAEDLAYVLFTSGSTGAPKGVMMPHRPVCNRIQWMQRAHPIRPSDRVLQHTSIGFDVSVGEIFLTLAAGATLVLAAPRAQRDPRYLTRLIANEGVTVLDVVPRMLRALMEEPGFGDCRLRQVQCGAETLPPDLARAFHARSAATLLNFYGPTETCIDVAVWTCTSADGDGAIPIGRPLANVRIHVLDDQRRLVAIGEPGEIYIGGACLARGYLGRPDLTAEAFVPNPIDPEHSRWLYRTGDFGRYRADGALEFLGRRDRQIKVRGMRVELEEVEAAIRRLPAVRDVAVTVKRVAGDESRMVAYVECNACGVASLRAQLARTLPGHMVPDQVLSLASLPRTASGKIDPSGLPDVDLQGTASDSQPRGALESAIAAVFGELLATGEIGRHDSFFELGGHSLLAARAMARLRLVTGIDLPLPLIFEAPDPAGLAAAIDRYQSAEPGSDAPAAVAAVPRSGRLTASFAQERLWLLEQLDGASAAYNIPVALRLDGPLRVTALQDTLNALALRHESLRTTFAAEDGVVSQRIADTGSLLMSIVDLQDLPDAQREAAARALAADEARRLFDLAAGPLARAALFTIRPDQHLFLLVIHHIVADGWSVNVLLRELATLYGGQTGSVVPALANLPIQYADFAQWQRARTTKVLVDRQLAYWRRQLDGVQPLLELPADRPRPPVQSIAGSRIQLAWPAALTASLRQLAREHGTTLFMALLAGFQAVLARYLNGDTKDIVVGTPTAGRPRAELEGIVGCFVNTLPLRLQCSDDPPFTEVLRRVRESAIGAYAHEDLPFEQLVERLNPPRSLSYSPIFQVMFILEDGSDAPFTLQDVTSTRVPLDTRTAKFDMTVSFRSAGDGMEGYLEYATAIFDRDTAERLAGHLEQFLRSAVENPGLRVSELALLTPAERDTMARWNATDTAVPSACVHELIEAQVDRTPAAIAVTFQGCSLTYRELDDRANLLAQRLRAMGVGPDTLVALHLGRSLNLVVSLLAVLKAGGAYVPLDPEYPAERLRFLLADSRAAVVVSDRPDALPATTAQILQSGSALSALPCVPPGRLSPCAAPSNLAYVIYTSGSTGTPKGVAVEHRSVANLFSSMDTRLGEPGVWLAVTSVSFDISVLELLWTLTRGFQIVLRVGDHSRFDEVNAVPHLIRAHQVTHLQCTPSQLQAVALEPDGVEALKNLRCLIVGGEPLPQALVNVLGRCPSRRLLNQYAPTETTVYSTSCEVEPDTRITIGRPIANTRIHLLDRHGCEVPVGVAGELHISGAGVARGYLGRPELTAERFIVNGAGTRMYRTGDLARYRPEGTIEFLGRADNQVKLRGHRIELGEIEAVIRAHPAIRDAAVTVRTDAAAGPRLVAYVVLAADSVESRELRSHVSAQLPAYMHPAAYVVLDGLPVTPNGKIDRRALPAETAARPIVQEDGERSEIEHTLARIWAEVLGLGDPASMPLTAGFFELGGHSLAAARVMARVREECGVSLPLRVLFESSTIKALAAVITPADRAINPNRPGIVSVVHPSGTKPPFFFLHAAMEAEGFYSQQLARCLGPDQPFYSLSPLGLDGGGLPASIAGIAARYVDLVVEHQAHGPYRLGGFCVSGPVVLEMARQLRSRGEQVALAVLVNSWIDNVSLRARLLRRTLDIAARILGRPDDWSIDLFLRLRALTGRPAPRPLAANAPLATRVRASYIRSAKAYAPEPMDTPLVHLRTAEEAGSRWDRLTPHFVERIVPGDHNTCVTEHLGTLAAALRRCLDDSYQSRGVPRAQQTNSGRQAATPAMP